MADLHVGSGQAYSTIGAAVHASGNDDNIIIHSGSYNEGVLLSGSTGLTFSAAGDGNVDVDPNYLYNNCFYVYQPAQGTTISGLTCSNSNYNNILVANTADVTLSDLYVRQTSTSWADELISIGSLSAGGSLTASNCVLFGPSDFGGKGFYVLGSSINVLIEQCQITQLSYGIEADGNHVHVDRCKVCGGGGSKSMTYGIFADGVSKMTASNCLVFDCATAFNNDNTDKALSIYNNTVYGVNTGVRAYKYLNAIDNNIFILCSTDAIKGDGGGDQTQPRNNCFYGNTQDYDNYNAGANDVFADPLFTNVSPPTFDFTLQESSPCKDTGVTIGWITDDYIGTTRPQGASFDIGAYEFIQGGGTTTPDDIVYFKILNGKVSKIVSSGKLSKLWG
jgi:hypothetical protein